MIYKELLVSVLTGIIVGLLTIFIVSNKFELVVWILLVFAVAIFAKNRFEKRAYLRNFLFSVTIGVCITLTHLVFLEDYLGSHKSEIAGLDKVKINDSYRLTLLVIAPIYWIVLGLLSCLLTFLAKRIAPIKQDKG